MKAKSTTNASANAGDSLFQSYKNDCKHMSAGGLARKYKLTYDSYRSVKQRAKKEGIPLDQRLSQFRTFLLTLGPRVNKSFTLDRKDPSGPYSPENCRWADKQTQTLNRRNAVRLRYNGEELPLKVWARRLGLEPDVLYKRRSDGWTDAEIITGVRRTMSALWPEGEEAQWERAYRQHRDGEESREHFYFRARKRFFELVMNEMKPYKENPHIRVPAELGARYVAAQRAMWEAKNKLREMCTAKATSLFDLLASSKTYRLAGLEEDASDEADGEDYDDAEY